jgi:AcrR family transcriptional regulator
MDNKLTNRQLQAIETRERIREKALELFKSSDYEQVSISDICNYAGMSVGSFYNYFASKEDLIMESYTLFDQFVEEDLSHQKYRSNIDAIKDALYNLAKSAESYGTKLSAQMLRVQLKDNRKQIIEESRFFDNYIKKLVSNAIAEGELVTCFSAEEISELLLRITRSVLFDWAMGKKLYSVSERTIHDIEMVLKHVDG